MAGFFGERGENMLHIAVCDDEAYMLELLEGMAADFFAGKNISAAFLRFSSGEELLSYNGPVDILFLDIQMKGMDGMETARRLRNHGFKGILIFITILQEMVFQSFEVGAYDYLVKPVERDAFENTMERLMTSMENPGETHLLVQKSGESSLLSFDEIVYCEVIDRKVYLHLRSSQVLDYYDRLEKLETKLDDRFFRCHRSYLINLQYIKSCKNGAACMEGGEEVPVSRLRSGALSAALLEYMKKWRAK